MIFLFLFFAGAPPWASALRLLAYPQQPYPQQPYPQQPYPQQQTGPPPPAGWATNYGALPPQPPPQQSILGAPPPNTGPPGGPLGGAAMPPYGAQQPQTPYAGTAMPPYRAQPPQMPYGAQQPPPGYPPMGPPGQMLPGGPIAPPPHQYYPQTPMAPPPGGVPSYGNRQPDGQYAPPGFQSSILSPESGGSSISSVRSNRGGSLSSSMSSISSVGGGFNDEFSDKEREEILHRPYDSYRGGGGGSGSDSGWGSDDEISDDVVLAMNAGGGGQKTGASYGAQGKIMFDMLFPHNYDSAKEFFPIDSMEQFKQLFARGDRLKLDQLKPLDAAPFRRLVNASMKDSGVKLESLTKVVPGVPMPAMAFLKGEWAGVSYRRTINGRWAYSTTSEILKERMNEKRRFEGALYMLNKEVLKILDGCARTIPKVLEEELTFEARVKFELRHDMACMLVPAPNKTGTLWRVFPYFVRGHVGNVVAVRQSPKVGVKKEPLKCNSTTKWSFGDMEEKHQVIEKEDKMDGYEAFSEYTGSDKRYRWADDFKRKMLINAPKQPHDIFHWQNAEANATAEFGCTMLGKGVDPIDKMKFTLPKGMRNRLYTDEAFTIACGGMLPVGTTAKGAGKALECSSSGKWVEMPKP